MIFWVIFYIILTTFLILFLRYEKKIIQFLKTKEEKLASDMSSKSESISSNGKRNAFFIIGIILVLIAFYVSNPINMYKDGFRNDLLKFQFMIIIALLVLNLGVILYKKKLYYALIANILFIVLGRAMLNYQVTLFYIVLAFLSIVLILQIFFYNKEIYTSLHNLESTFVAVAIVLLIQNFYIGNFMVPTGSMEGTILIKDRFFANMIKYKFSNPKRKDIIAFKEPKDNKVLYTKRLIGLPGETLQITNSGDLLINKEKTVVNGKESPLSFDEIVKKRNLQSLTYEEWLVIEAEERKEYLKKDLEYKEISYSNAFIGDNEIYIPKKGDKVTLDKIYYLNNEAYENVVFNDYERGEVTPDEFKSIVSSSNLTYENFIVGENKFDQNLDTSRDYYYFTLKVEGVDKPVMNILDFKYNNDTMNKLLSGESIELDHDYYFVLGDNTENSLDSRFWGYVQDNRIKGEILIRFWPLKRFGLVK